MGVCTPILINIFRLVYPRDVFLNFVLLLLVVYGLFSFVLESECLRLWTMVRDLEGTNVHMPWTVNQYGIQIFFCHHIKFVGMDHGPSLDNYMFPVFIIL